jgi:glycosyltransferase involved in cell wall biosynthesis
MKTHLKYVLITPARNEEAYIEKTIQSVISQTVLPRKWVIVSDGSTDSTDDIVKKYMAGNTWIELIRMPEHGDRQFAAKVHCFNAGYEKVKDVNYDIIANLDADISFEEDYFEFLLRKFAKNPQLGVAGTPFVEDSSHYDYRFTNIEHVSGACQLFRRECFEKIGGYVPIKGGGIDWTAVTTARMKGWKTRTFTEKVCFHNKKMGTGNSSALMSWFRHGRKDYCLGGHPLWQLFRTVYQMSKKPYFIGGLLLFFGYNWAYISRVERPISQELMEFHRREQMQRLKNTFRKALKLK